MPAMQLGKFTSESDGSEEEEEEEEEEETSELQSLVSVTRIPREMNEVLMFKIAPSTSDGLTLAAALWGDTRYRQAEGIYPATMQLVFMLGLQCSTVVLQFMLVYWTFVSGLLYELDPYAEALVHTRVIEDHLVRNHSLMQNKTDLTIRVLNHCRADTTHGLSHMAVLGIWGTRMVNELSDASWRCFWLWKLGSPTRLGKLIDWSQQTGQVKFLSLGMRALLIVLVSLPQFLVCLSLGWTGGKMLAVAEGMSGLVLKALTLQYIIGLEELSYSAFCSLRFKQLADSVKISLVVPRPPRAWKMWGACLLKLAAVLVYLVFISWVFRNLRRLRLDCRQYFRAFPEESRMHAPVWLFGTFPEWALPTDALH